ncbi:MAG TPA: prenyltransferase [Mycobacteriales bacterium]|jgi:1,4-dihydroxy-2-naphthoate octaprenyltransferase|nr:prenyltransferase [Mycobacteriales bacterium]
MTVTEEPRRELAPPPLSGHGPRSWLYALTTTNPPPAAGNDIDGVTRWLVVTRAAVLPMTLFAGLVGGLLAVRAPGFNTLDLVLAIAGIVLAHLNNNLTNDLFDTSVGTDQESYPRALYAPHPLLSNLVTARQLYAAIAATTIGDLVIAAVLLDRRGWGVVAFATAGIILSIAYTAPPLRLKKHGLGEPDVLVVWGPLMVGGTYLAATGHLPWQVIVASVPYGLLCTTVLMGKHVDKIPYDEPTGTRTLPVILGERRAKQVTLGLLAAFYVATGIGVAVKAMPWPAVVIVLALPRLGQVWKAMLAPPPAEPPKHYPIWPLWYAAAAFLHVRRAGALLVVGLIVSAAANWGWSWQS